MSEVTEFKEHLPNVERPSASTPAHLLQVAMDQGADLDRLEKLMDMQIKWEANEARKAYVLAMSKFRAEVPTITKNRAGHNSNYATLDNITSEVNPILARYGLSFAWVTEQAEKITVHCDVTHDQGHSTRVSLTSPPEDSGSKNDIQAIGSAVSYLQRYTLLSALGLATGEGDDDGKGAARNKKEINSDTNVDPEAVAILEAAAEKGGEAFQAAFKKLSPSQRGSLTAAVVRPLRAKAGL